MRKCHYREIASRIIRRPLWKNENVHHINGNHLDNHPENLLVCSAREHMKIHALMKRGLSGDDAVGEILRNRKGHSGSSNLKSIERGRP